MTIPAPDLMDRIGRALVAVATDQWIRLELSASGAADMTITRVAANLTDGTTYGKYSLGAEGSKACTELRAAMHQPGKGTWYNATFTVSADRKIEAQFDYDTKPFDGDADDELLLEDQDLYPRDAEHLPDWHPAKVAG